MRLFKFIFVIATCIVFVNTGCGQQSAQPCKNISFKIFDTILNDLKQKGEQSIYFDSLDYNDYEAMACLDMEASYSTLKCTNPAFDKVVGFDSSHLATYILDAKKENYVINLNSISDLFCNTENLKFVMRKHFKDESILFKLSTTIYIKDNAAYFSIYGPTWEDTFLATYRDKSLTLTFLWGTQE